jgi:uncharacterized damage-inducible protein DinB
VRKPEIEILFDYLYWLRDRVLEATTELGPEGFLEPETVTTRDLRATLVHELDVEWSWRERLIHGAFPEGPDLAAADYPDLDAVAEHWRRDEDAMRAWIDGLTDEQLATPAPDKGLTLPLWYFVMHLVSHAIQQLSEAAVVLTRAGASPGDLGFLEFANERLREGAEG